MKTSLLIKQNYFPTYITFFMLCRIIKLYLLLQDKPFFPGGDPFHFCGGAVIDENNVLTAAHCCRGQSAEDLQIVAGEHTLYSEDGTEQVRDIAALVIHEDYGSFSHQNDVCLLQLAEPLELK